MVLFQALNKLSSTEKKKFFCILEDTLYEHLEMLYPVQEQAILCRLNLRGTLSTSHLSLKLYGHDLSTEKDVSICTS